MPTKKLTITIKKHHPALHPLRMGGTNPQGEVIAANQSYLTLNGQPWLPVMGEFHFSRYPEDLWEEELLKMKAGGINIIATYLFWIHIEETEGQFNWSRNCNLRRFVELCAKHGLYAYPRIGPWAHGECRNGGFPDWLLEQCGPHIREDTEPYLTFVQRFYQEIFQQIDGLLWKDGGPVIGIQIENELLDNAGHISTLKRIAQEVGLYVPIYTMTGWGPAQVPAGEVIPVFGGYPDAFWDRQVHEWSRPSRKHYFFSSLRDDNTIGADLRQRDDIPSAHSLEMYPYGTCETGGGMQVSYHRRPLIQPEDIAALALVKVGNGSNLQGYYMYHGGANPRGMKTSMQESQASGYPNDLPAINYDFQAPLGQYGQVREVYHNLRPLHLFLHDFGNRLAPLRMTLPDQTPSGLDDRTTPRWAVRSNGKEGFVFINNYQRIEPLAAHEQVQFLMTLPNQEVLIPGQPINLPAGLQAIWPVNLEIDGVKLTYATAQLICQVPAPDGTCYVFFAADGIESEFVFDAPSVKSCIGSGSITIENGAIRVNTLTPGTGCNFKLTAQNGRTVSILLLSQAEARQLWKAEIWGQERLFLSPDSLMVDGDNLRLQTRVKTATIAIYPAPTKLHLATGETITGKPDGLFRRYSIDLQPTKISVQAKQIQAAGLARSVPIGPAGVAQSPEEIDFASAETWHISFPQQTLTVLHDIFLRIHYTGDAARAYIGDQLIDDDFYHGRVWEIGLARFAPQVFEQGITLRILPLRADAPIYLPPESQPAFQGAAEFLQVHEITAEGLVEVVLLGN